MPPGSRCSGIPSVLHRSPTQRPESSVSSISHGAKGCSGLSSNKGACARTLVCLKLCDISFSAQCDRYVYMSRPRSQLHFPAQGLRSEMPASNRTHVIFGELADRAADEEARRISSELGIVASLRVTCRLHVVKPFLQLLVCQSSLVSVRGEWRSGNCEVPMRTGRRHQLARR